MTLSSRKAGLGLAVDEGQACWNAFRILKLVVTNWFSDATTSHNPFADSLLQHFNRWVASPSSLLFDPALHRIVRRLMGKVHAHLVTELRRFGATVVFADFSRVVFATNKLDLDEAKVCLCAGVRECLCVSVCICLCMFCVCMCCSCVSGYLCTLAFICESSNVTLCV